MLATHPIDGCDQRVVDHQHRDHESDERVDQQREVEDLTVDDEHTDIHAPAERESDQRFDDRHSEVAHEGDDCRTGDNRHSQVDDIASIGEFLESLEHGGSLDHAVGRMMTPNPLDPADAKRIPEASGTATTTTASDVGPNPDVGSRSTRASRTIGVPAAPVVPAPPSNEASEAATMSMDMPGSSDEAIAAGRIVIGTATSLGCTAMATDCSATGRAGAGRKAVTIISTPRPARMAETRRRRRPSPRRT